MEQSLTPVLLYWQKNGEKLNFEKKTGKNTSKSAFGVFHSDLFECMCINILQMQSTVIAINY